MLRPYQEKAVNEIRNMYALGVKRVLLHLPTGSGKTVIFCYMAKQALERGKRVIVVVRGRKLVQQASDRLTREGIPHGVMMGDHPMRAPERYIQVCSITTLYKRLHTPKADLVIIDEAHFATAPEFHWLAEKYPNAYFLPVTATPYCKKPLKHIASEIVSPIPMQEIINQGYLVDARYFAPTKPDLSGVKIRAGDYVESDLDKVMSRAKIIGDIVTNYQKFSPDLSALCFCVSIAHAGLIADQFNEAGIPATVLHAGSPDDVRDAKIKELENGPLKVICNVGVMGVGVDIPWLRTVILARPTKSLNLYLQQIGRGTRPYPGKENFLIIDHANNVMTHGYMTNEREAKLDGSEPKERDPLALKTCKECFAIYKSQPVCPACGYLSESKPRKIEHEDGELVEVSPGSAQKPRIATTNASFLEAIQRIKHHLSDIETRRKPDGMPYSPWVAFYRVKTEMAGRMDEDAIVRLFRAEAKARGYSVGRH